MYIALNKNKERVHISQLKDNEEYFCPICGEKLIARTGEINAHHFAHKSNSECLIRDGWHYDMSEWHYNWQNQFPKENQEIVFTNNGKTHRADVFINNTVIEFQHSQIKEEEFYDRNIFYKDLGYKVIWIFDAEEKEIEYVGERGPLCYKSFAWKRPNKIFKKVDWNDKYLEIYFQLKESIWKRQPNYRSIENFADLDIVNNLIKTTEINYDYSGIISDDWYSDYEFLETFIEMKIKEHKKYSYKKVPNLHNISDEIYIYDQNIVYDFYGYCPYDNNEFYSHKECHGCGYLDVHSMRCTYRLKDIQLSKITDIYDIEYDEDGRIISFDVEIDEKKKKYQLKPIPRYRKTLLEIIIKNSNMNVARFINTETGKFIQMSAYNMTTLKNTKKCYCKLCSRENYKQSSYSDIEIYDWNKPVWVLTWFKLKQPVETNEFCPVCGCILMKIEGKNGPFYGCSGYPTCRYTKNI